MNADDSSAAGHDDPDDRDGSTESDDNAPFEFEMWKFDAADLSADDFDDDEFDEFDDDVDSPGVANIEILGAGAFELTPIPPTLHSAYEEGPFTKCISCELPLDANPYQIQKTYRGSQVVVEMAICYQCAQDCNDEFSQESLAVMHEFVSRLIANDVEPERCRGCGQPPSEFKNFTMIGICVGEFLLMPSVSICEACEEGVQSRLSKQTRDSQGEFFRDHFPGVPADLDMSPLNMM